MRIAFIITGLATGGAEKQLSRLLSRLHGPRIEAAVVSLAARGPLSAEIEALGVPVWHLGLCRLSSLAAAALKLVGIVRRFKPDLLQGWMYHGNVAATLIAPVGAKAAPVAWGIRQSLYDLDREKPRTRNVIRLGARLSRRAAAIVYNAECSRAQHEAHGYARAHGLVIDNGFDAQALSPDPVARDVVRGELGLPSATPLVGLVARYHPMKGHDIFLQAAADLAARRSDVHFVCIGQDVGPENDVLAPLFARPSLAGRIHCLGRRDDVARLTAALDVAAMPSRGEAFPNTVAEAMSCGVPVVATDVGDVKRIVADTGRIVPSGDAGALGGALEDLLVHQAQREYLGEAARRRVRELYSLDAAASRYSTLYEELLGNVK